MITFAARRIEPISTTRHRLFVITLLTFHVGLVAQSATLHSPTIDEVSHLPAGLFTWKTGRFDLYRVNPPLGRMVAALPVLFMSPVYDWKCYSAAVGSRHEFLVGRDFLVANGRESITYYIVGRWACLLFTILGAWCCYTWARQLYGLRAGTVALALWCSNPTVIAHAQLITSDLAGVSCGVFAAFAFWKWLNSGTWWLAIYSGLALGLALLAKTTCLILLPIWCLVFAYTRLRRRSHAALAPKYLHMLYILLLGLWVLNAGYLFEGSFTPLKDYQFVSQVLSGQQYVAPSANRFADSFLGQIWIPLPRDFVIGIDLQRSDFESNHTCYLAGTNHEGGLWYFYLYAYIVKEPLGGHCLMLLVAALMLLRLIMAPRRFRDNFLLFCIFGIACFVSSQTGMTTHYRYFILVLPYVFVLQSQFATTFLMPSSSTGLTETTSHPNCQSASKSCARKTAWTFRWDQFPRLAQLCIQILGYTMVLLSAASSISVYPHSLSYFNEWAGGPRQGPLHLLDSNIDWGQDLMFLERWANSQRLANDFHVAYFGSFPPSLLNMAYLPVPMWPSRPEPGWYAVSVNLVYGNGLLPESDANAEYQYFRRFRPVATAGYSIYIYHLTAEDIDRLNS